MGQIAIEGMEVYAYHGCFEEEQLIGTRFSVSIYIKTDTTKAEHSDDLGQTIDYQAVYNIIKEEMAIKSKLLEHVGRRILDHLFLDFPTAAKARLRIQKLNPPVGGNVRHVSVTLKEARHKA